MPFNGTIIGSPTFTSGKFGNAMNCSAGNGCSLPIPGPLQFATGEHISIEFWFKAAAIPGISTAVIVGYGTNGFVGIRSTGKAVFYLQPSGVADGATNICDGAWHAIACTYDGTTLRLYIDGTLDASSTGATSQASNMYENVGTNYSNGGTGFDMTCSIDELSICTGANYVGGSYTLPTSPFPVNRVNQIALYTFDANAADSNNQSYIPLAVTENIIVLSEALGNVQLQANVTPGSGAAPIVYSWYKSTIVNFTPGGGNLLNNGAGVTGATTNTLTDTTTLTPGTAYYYVCSATDSNANTVTWYHRPVYAAITTLKICAIGDSTSVAQAQCNYVPAVQQSANILGTLKGIRQVTVVNTAVSGTKSQDWYNGSAQADLTAALAACGGSFTGFYVFVRLGVNDAQAGIAAATFGANMSGLVAYVVSNGGKVFVSYPTWREPGSFGEGLEYGTPVVETFDESTTPFLIAYQPYIDALVDTVNVFAGDKMSYLYSSENAQAFFFFGLTHTYLTNPGAIHPTEEGTTIMGANEAQALQNLLYPVSSTIVHQRAPHRGR